MNEQNSTPFDDRVRLIRMQSFFKVSAANPLSILAGGALLALVLRGAGTPDAWLLAWFMLLLLAAGALTLYLRHVIGMGLTTANATHCFRIRALLGCLNCSLFGISVFFLPQHAAGTTHVFVFVILTTVMTVGYMVYATVFSYSILINVLTLFPFTAFCFYRYFVTQDFNFLLIGIAAVLWQFVVVGKAFQVSRLAVGAIESSERLRDEIIERKLVEEALKINEDQSRRLASMLRLMCDNVPDMIWAKDLDGRYTFVNMMLCEKILNISSPDEALGKTYDFFARREQSRRPDDPEWHTLGQFSQDVHRHALGREEPTIFEEAGTVRGKFVFLDVHQARFINDQGEVIGTVGCARDITERKASEAMMHHIAHHDALTDLPNRLLLTDRLRQGLAQTRRDKGKLAVLFLDLDNLKPVNDTYGHDIGDLLLKEVAVRLRSVITRQSDTASRLGGDEFVLLLQRINVEKDAVAVAEKILHALSLPYSIGLHTINISASIGIAIYPRHGEEVNQLLRNADAAMYAAKDSGRNGYRFFDDSMTRVSGE